MSFILFFNCRKQKILSIYLSQFNVNCNILIILYETYFTTQILRRYSKYTKMQLTGFYAIFPG